MPKSLKYFILIIINWLFHGFLYMDRGEKFFFILLDLFFFVIIYPFLKIFISDFYAILLAILISHTLHWIINGQLFVLLKNLGHTKTSKPTFEKYIEFLQKRVSSKRGILAVIVYGSYCRGTINEHSDLDIRIIRKPGVINCLYVCCFTFLERSKAFFSHFPLDVFVFDSVNSLKRMDQNENAIILYNPTNMMIKNNKDL